MRNFKEEFIKLAHDKKNREKLEKKLIDLNSTIDESIKELKSLEVQLLKEKKDVDRLENLTFHSIFHKLRGNIDEKLSKEKLEFLRAESNYLEKKYYLDSLKSSRESIISSLKSLENLDERQELLIEDLSDNLLNFSSTEQTQIKSCLDKINYSSSEKEEISQALNVSEKLLAICDEVISYLESAQNWGIYDMLGGKFIATHLKHQEIDNAAHSLNKLNFILDQYNKELSELKNTTSISLKIDSFTYTMDYFFDNFFTDSLVQSKINDALNSVNQLKSKIIETQFDLNQCLVNITEHINNLNNELENFFISNL